MKKLIAITACLFFYSTFAASSFSLVRSADNSEFWKSSTEKNTYIALTKRSNSKNFSLDGIEGSNFSKKLERSKKKMLEMMGASTWLVSDRKWKINKSNKTLTLVGSYIDRKGQKVNFIEKHIFSKMSTVQGLLTTTGEKANLYFPSFVKTLNVFSGKVVK